MIYIVTFNPGIDRTLVVHEIAFQTVLRAQLVYLNFGGKGFNVSRILKQFQISSVNLSFLGGATGDYMEKEMTRSGYAVDSVKIHGETRNNIVIIETSSTKHIKVNEPGPEVNPKEQELLLNKIKFHAKPDDIWALCGSLPPKAPEKLLEEAINLIKKAGGKVFLDTSGRALERGIKVSPFLVKPNRQEASELTGIQINTIDQAVKAAEMIAKEGVPIVVITLGDEGLLYYHKGDVYHAYHPVVSIRNPTGAGDSVMAGLLYGISTNQPIVDTLKWAVASGTASAKKDEVASSTLAEIKDCFDQVHVNRINLPMMKD